MSLKSNFELMADYNQWMNKSIYDAAAKLSAEQLSGNIESFFGSIIGTLNHILVGDIIWLKRIADHPSQLQSLNYVRSLAAPQALNQILYTDLDSLLAARTKMDGAILSFTQELSNEVLASTLYYNSTKGDPYAKNMGHIIQHFFNHQTHHRGQASALLYQAGIDVGVTDLLAGIPDE
ncbi:MAG: DinB family protein [Paraglaciecola sp.]|uniref:DinB family protein n=1 Tax=Paraglaciecola sp. TaxID=1920173 RepID=UPI003266FF03